MLALDGSGAMVWIAPETSLFGGVALPPCCVGAGPTALHDSTPRDSRPSRRGQYVVPRRPGRGGVRRSPPRELSHRRQLNSRMIGPPLEREPPQQVGSRKKRLGKESGNYFGSVSRLLNRPPDLFRPASPAALPVWPGTPARRATTAMDGRRPGPAGATHSRGHDDSSVCSGENGGSK